MKKVMAKSGVKKAQNGMLAKTAKAKPMAKKAPAKMAMKKSSVTKAQEGLTVKPTADSTLYYQKQQKEAYESASRNMTSPKYSDSAFKRAAKIGKDIDRQDKKGKPGYDN
jgi:surface antigen